MDEKESIYDDIKTNSDASDDLFEDVFGEDEEKKQAKLRMQEKAKELLEKNKKNEDNTDLENTTKNIGPKEINETKENNKIKEPIKKIDKIKENKKIVDLTIDRKEIKKAKERLEVSSGKRKTNFNEIVEEGLEKTLLNENYKSTTPKKELSGKLNINVEFEEEELKEKDNIITKLTGIEKNIVKSVIENKAVKAIKEEDELAEYLLKEQGIKEEGINTKKNIVSKIIEKTGLEKDKEDNIINPKLAFLTNDETGHVFIGRKKSVLKQYGEESALFIGRVQEEDLYHKQVYLDGLNPHVVFVCGARGSGKSYVLGVLAEELAIKNKNVGIVVVDPIGVFWSMKHPNKENKELELLADWEIMPRGLDNVKVFIPVGMKGSVPKSTYDSTFSIQPALLNAEDWCLTFGIDRFSPTGLLMEKGISKVKLGYTTQEGKVVRGKENTFSLEDLIACFSDDAELNNREKGYKTDSIRALVSRFDASKNWGIFDEKGTPLSQLSRAGQMAILDTSFLEDNVSALVIGIIARRLLSARKISTRREAAGKFSETTMEDLVELNVPPTWLFIDEAHTLIPGGNQKTPASSALVEYVKQGRRPGLSLVFATQQPSAIDTRVLSQLDIIMSHKLVFDDDVKAIWKRTPTRIPNQYKKPNFIKTLPVGTALTGDSQETTSRAFIMNIRPRMSQHEGRTAETVEVKHELSKDQVEVLAISIILKQLEKDPRISLHSIEQTLDTLNNTYKQNVKLELIISLLEKKGLNVDEEYVYAKGVLEEMKQDEEDELKKLNEENQTEDSVNETNADTQTKKEVHTKDDIQTTNDGIENAKDVKKEFIESIELTALKNSVQEKDARLLLAKHRLKKKLGLFGEEEILDRLNLKYGIIYKIKYNYFSQTDAYQIGEAYVNSLTSEFIHDNNGMLIESRGLKEFIDLNEVEIKAIKLLSKISDIKELALKLEMEEGNAKRVLEKLISKDIVTLEKNKTDFNYYLKKVFDIPNNPLHVILSSIGKRPIIEVDGIAIINPKISEKDSAELLKKLWKHITIKEITQIYLPVWEGVLKKKTGEERIIIIDGINGKKIN